MTLRDLERDSIRAFVQAAADDGYLSGRVLDYGCGKQPYRDIVEAAGGEYTPYDAPTFPASTATMDTTGLAFGGVFDTVLCTQVIQYQWRPLNFLREIKSRYGHGYKVGGQDKWLVMTYPTNWPEVEGEDLWRFTKAGMSSLLLEAEFEIVKHEKRGVAAFRYEEFALGYGVIARA